MSNGAINSPSPQALPASGGQGIVWEYPDPDCRISGDMGIRIQRQPSSGIRVKSRQILETEWAIEKLEEYLAKVNDNDLYELREGDCGYYLTCWRTIKTTPKQVWVEKDDLSRHCYRLDRQRLEREGRIHRYPNTFEYGRELLPRIENELRHRRENLERLKADRQMWELRHLESPTKWFAD